MIKITREDVDLIKSLFDAYGISHITAIGEADILCASLVLKKKVYAVLTEDMDLFAYDISHKNVHFLLWLLMTYFS